MQATAQLLLQGDLEDLSQWCTTQLQPRTKSSHEDMSGQQSSSQSDIPQAPESLGVESDITKNDDTESPVTGEVYIMKTNEDDTNMLQRSSTHHQHATTISP